MKTYYTPDQREKFISGICVGLFGGSIMYLLIVITTELVGG